MSLRRRSPGVPRHSSVLFFPLLIVVLTLSSGLLTQACRDQSTFEIDRNQPPETVLTGAPGDSTTTFYFTHLHWYGVDPDGRVVAYEFAVTDSIPEDEEAIEWIRTQKTDSLFAIPVGETQEIMGRRFYVRAIDNENRVDPTPARTFFTVRDNEPPAILFTRATGIGPGGESVEITSTDRVFPTDTIPTGWRVEFAWTGADGDVALTEDGEVVSVGEVLGYSYHLSPIESNYLGGSLADTVAAYDNLFSESFTMFVRGTDDAGFSALNPTVRSFVWNFDPQTYFETGLDSSCACTKVHFFDGDGTEHFNGDTLALSGSGQTVTARIGGFDPDDPSGEGGVTNFEVALYRDGGGFGWRRVNSDLPVQNTGLKTGNYVLQARCSDLLGRIDGSPAALEFYVNYEPYYLLEYRIGSLHYEQTPNDGDILTLDEINAAGGIPATFIARDRDRLGGDRNPRFSYRFAKPALHSTFDFAEPYGAGEMRNLQSTFLWDNPLPPRRSDRDFFAGEYELLVRVTEVRASGDNSNARSGIRRVRFTVTE